MVHPIRYFDKKGFFTNFAVSQIAFGIAHRPSADTRYLPTREYYGNLLFAKHQYKYLI